MQNARAAIIAPARMPGTALVPESEILDDLARPLDVRPLHVVVQTTARAHHHEEAAAATVIRLVGAEVLGEVIDALREEGHLHAGRAGIGLVHPELLERRRVVESHESGKSGPPIRAV